MDGPLIAHVDIDAFFASVEQALDPALRGRPVVVGGGVEGRGVVASASYEARRFGLTAGMPIHRAREACPEGVFLPPNFPEYNRFSEQVFDVLSSVSPSVEQVSLDEAYVDLRGCERIYGVWSARPLARLPFVCEAEGIYRRREKRAVPPEQRVVLPESCRWLGAVGLGIKRAVRARTGLDVSVGLASSKGVAKAASDYGKPDGLVLIEAGREASFLSRLDLKDVPGVGRSTLEALRRWNVRTVEQARALPLEVLEDAFGTERGAALYHVLRGEAGGDAEAVHGDELPRSISRETTFWTASSDYEFAEAMLFYLAEQLGRSLRRQRLRGRTVHVKLRYEDFTAVQCSRSLGHLTDRDDEVFEAAQALLRARWCRNRRLRTVGVGLTDLRKAQVAQPVLFDDGAERGRRLDRCLDALRERFGFSVIRRGPAIRLAGPAGDAMEEHPLPIPARP